MVGGSPGVDQPGAARHWDETMRGHEAARQAAGERLRTAAALLLEAIADDAPGEAALVAEIAGLLGNVTSPALSSGESPWPGEPLTESETRVLRYLPTHMGAPDIAAELCLSANTAAGRPSSAPGPSACSPGPPPGPKQCSKAADTAPPGGEE
jgi:hypothetical protein